LSFNALAHFSRVPHQRQFVKSRVLLLGSAKNSEGLNGRTMPAIRSTVNRSIWKTVVNRPKTRASAQAVLVIRQLAEIPECVSPFHGNPATGLMFHSGGGEPMGLDKLAQRIVRPAVEAIR